MSTEVVMPKLGVSMVEGKIIEWRKKEGDAVEKGEILFVIETEKVTYEVEALSSGVLGRILVPEGESRPVGAVLAYLLAPGETAADLPVPEEEKAELPLQAAGGDSGSTTAQPYAESAPSQRAREKVRISPVAKRVAEEHNVDITHLHGTGPDGLIVKRDILALIEEAPKQAAQAEGAELPPPKTTLIPLTGMRRTIARQMAESFKTPHSWIVQQASAVEFKEARDRLMVSIEQQTGQRLTYTDLIIKLTARAVEDYPTVNARWSDEGIQLIADIHIGLATNVPEGLIVPVIRDANTKSLAEITAIRADIVARGREGKLGIDEMTGSTITITNAGMTGIEYGFPILNPPEAAILALGAIMERPLVLEGQVVPLLSVTLTLGIDHRVLDGFVASEFLNRVKQLIEQPLLLL